MNNLLGVYIHIPFCRGRCKYCDFVSSTGGEDAMREYVAALIGEIKFRAPSYRDYIVDTLFIGGGTPSALYLGAVKEITDALRHNFNCAIREATAECNPESLTSAKLDEYMGAGITRISMGVQSLSRDTLSALGRRHTARQAVDAAMLVVNGGLDLSCDIMLATPYQSEESAKRDIETLADIGARHISAYMLSLEQGTALAAEYGSGKYVYDDDYAADIYSAASEALCGRGFDIYEVSNWAKEGRQCQHNLKYWRRQPYLGLGAAAHSLIGNTRFYNSHDVRRYLDGADSGEYPSTAEARLSASEAEEELVMLSLRTAEGLDISAMGDAGLKYSDRARRHSAYFNIGDGRISVKKEYFPVLSRVTLLMTD